MSRYLDLAQPRIITPKYVNKPRVFKKILRPVVPIYNETLDRLATPAEFKITPKWMPPEPPEKIIIERPVVPDDNSIIERLAQPTPFKVTPKYVSPSEQVETVVVEKKRRKKALSARIIALAKPNVRLLIETRNKYGSVFGKKWSDKMKHRINAVWELPYFKKKKAKMDRAAERARREKIRNDILLKKEKLRCARRYRFTFEVPRLPILQLPYKRRKWCRISRGRKKPLTHFQERLKVLSKPTKGKIFRSSSDDTILLERERAFRRAQLYVPSKRIKNLAISRPKPIRKSSVKSFDVFKIKPSALRFETTQRLNDLAIPKEDRSDPCAERRLPWVVSEAAKNCVASPRIEDLAKPKDRRSNDRPLPAPISDSTKNATASARVTELATPKKNFGRRPRPFPTPVSDAAKNATASSRVEELAQPRDRGLPPYTLPRKITDAAKNYVASERITQLAKPKIDWSLLVNETTMNLKYFHTHYHRCEEVEVEEKIVVKRKYCQKEWNVQIAKYFQKHGIKGNK